MSGGNTGGAAAQRDYRKFLNAEGVLDPGLLPREVYVCMVYHLRDTTDELAAAFRDVFLSYDLEEYITRVKAETGEELLPAEAARRMFDSLDDADWWDAMEAIEVRLHRRFAEDPAAWAAFVDPVYDQQERDGWRRLS